MSDALRWLLRLDTLHFGQAGVEFDFARPLPLWLWVLVGVAAVALGWISYRKLEGARAARITLGTLRALLLILIAVLIAGPRLVRSNEVEEPDWVLVLVDRSASLSVKDVLAPTGASAATTPARITRDQQLKTALDASREVWKQLGAERVVVWLGFDAGAYEIKTTSADPATSPTPASPSASLGEPLGRRTDLNRALEQALKRAAARPLSGVIVLSDGRSVEEPSRAVLRRLEAEKIPVFTLALGSNKGVADLAVRRAEAPRTAFVKDAVPVQVDVERIGANLPGAPASRATVELIDNATGAVLDSRDITFDAPEHPPAPPSTTNGASEPTPDTPAPSLESREQKVTLLTRPTVAGNQNWSVRIRPPSGTRGADAITEDLVEDNNRADLPVELVDRPLRVLYLDGYPRWEYRYLKNVLIREPSIASVCTILAPGRRYIQEGTETLDALPNSPEEWAHFDVFILGDVYPSVFTTEQLAQIRDRVATSGLGLVWIAGEGAVPNAWRGTPLADLLPFSLGEADTSPIGSRDSAADAISAWGEPVTMTATPAADQIGVLRLAETQTNNSWWPPRLSDPRTGWSQLRWAQRIDPKRLKPTAEVLAIAQPALVRDNAKVDQSPLVLSMRFGAGRSIYVATDEIWRWRYGRGEYFTERFWLQIVRLLGRESVARSGKPAILRVLPDRGETDRPVRIELTLLDQSLVQAKPSSLRVRVKRDGSDEAIELSLSPEAVTGATREAKALARTYVSTWIPTESGRYHVDAIDPVLISSASSPALSAAVEIWQPDDELRQPQTDHALLARLSRTTGGQVLTPADLSQLPKLLPNRRLKLAGEPDVQTLWDTPLALILVVLLLTAEWLGRRLLRLA
jgi:hypothetical protein